MERARWSGRPLGAAQITAPFGSLLAEKAEFSKNIRSQGGVVYGAVAGAAGDEFTGVWNGAMDYGEEGQSMNSRMTSLVGTMKHVSTPLRKIVIRHTLSRPCRGRVASVS
eukprot:3222326-Prymnesium_polylepis.1